jgi:hypothetical protein
LTLGRRKTRRGGPQNMFSGRQAVILR